MAHLISLALIIGLIPSGLAGPACAQKYKTASDCISRCNSKWGYPGLMMGTDPWGTVMHLTGSSENDWDTYIAQACGEQMDANSTADASSSTSSSTAEATQFIHQGLGTQSVTSTSVSTRSSAKFTTSAIRSTTSTTSSRTTSTTSTKATTTSTTTQAKATTTQAPTTPTTPPAPKATHTTAQAPQTTANSNSGSNSGSSSGGSGSRASSADQQAYLEAHNTIRSQHGANPVTWSNDAAAKAQEWADKCTNQHSGGTLGPLGENLAAGTGTFSIAQAVKAWTDEVSNYNPGNPQASHFTQVVWKATSQIGCAVATCNGIFAGYGAAQYYVCEYSVQGNVEGEFGANVQV